MSKKDENTAVFLHELHQINLVVLDSSQFCYLQPGAGTSKKIRPTFANANALKLSSELLRVFVTEAVERAATIAEAEGASTIEATHLERVLPQLLLDF
ncbi:hypothetical protein RHGRI_034993 [Rhododendron griersonianum]|uniref:Centromere protein X n=1 Tax=Rhododendron griersonianum TaxID=479676 RepID=A0AAV6I2Z2_9ERIC|nr:hypothetical protein RHGRI_034993 [Rhododendron griersonianum]